MKVSPHIDDSELACHDGTPYPPEWITDPTRGVALLKAIERIRAEWGQPCHLLSVYRTVDYNKAIYAARNEQPTKSQHSEGRAADIRIDGVSTKDLHQRILELYQSGELEIGGLGFYDKDHGDFVHIDVRVGYDHLCRWENYGS